MRSTKVTIFFLLAALAVSVITAAALSYRADGGASSRGGDGRQEPSDRLPVADYDAPETPDPKKRAKRRAKGARYDGRHTKIIEMPEVREVTEAESWIERLPPLPVSQSDVVALGKMTEAMAYLSNDKKDIYSEFTVQIEGILKDESGLQLTPGATLTAEREGGSVRFLSGHIQSYKLSGQGVPRVGSRYVFFLKHNGQDQDFLLLTAFELRSGGVAPMDKVARQSVYAGLDEQSFLHEVRSAIASPTRAPGRRRKQ